MPNFNSAETVQQLDQNGPEATDLDTVALKCPHMAAMLRKGHASHGIKNVNLRGVAKDLEQNLIPTQMVSGQAVGSALLSFCVENVWKDICAWRSAHSEVLGLGIEVGATKESLEADRGKPEVVPLSLEQVQRQVEAIETASDLTYFFYDLFHQTTRGLALVHCDRHEHTLSLEEQAGIQLDLRRSPAIDLFRFSALNGAPDSPAFTIAPRKLLHVGFKTGCKENWGLMGAIPAVLSEHLGRTPSLDEVMQVARSSRALLHSLEFTHIKLFNGIRLRVKQTPQKGKVALHWRPEQLHIVEGPKGMRVEIKPQVVEEACALVVLPEERKLRVGCVGTTAKGVNPKQRVTQEFSDWVLEVAEKFYFPRVLELSESSTG